MRLKVFSLLFFCFLSLSCFSQYRLAGLVASAEDSISISDCVVYLNNGERTAISDNRGRFSFEDVPNGDHTLHFTSAEFKYVLLSVKVGNGNESVRVFLEPRTEILEEVMITDANTSFGFTRMHPLVLFERQLRETAA